ncbi:MAG: IS200/IS605 family transposase [Capsulimonadaceae bacterium]
MPHSKTQIYVHLVWATWNREMFITEAWENRLYGCIRGRIEDERARCEAIAIGGMPDHVHVLVRLRPAVSVSSLVKNIKGVSSRMMNSQLRGGDVFKWQPGYGAFSLSHSHLPNAESYIRNQKRHHGDGSIWPLWEDTGELDE